MKQQSTVFFFRGVDGAYFWRQQKPEMEFGRSNLQRSENIGND